MTFQTALVGTSGNVHTVRLQSDIEIFVIEAPAPKRCPACGERAHGTVEVTHSVAFGSVKGGTLSFVGETDSDQVWNNQQTVYYRDLPVLECGGCYAWFVHPKVTSVE